MNQQKQGKELLPKQCLLVLLFIACFFWWLTSYSTRFESNIYSESQAYMTQNASQDLQALSKAIKQSELQLLLDQTPSYKERLRLRFGNAVILGDSIVEGLLDYDILSSTQAIATRGRRTDNCEDDIKKAAGLAPETVFLTYGMNDLEYCRGDQKRFISQYQEVIKNVKKQMPNTTIYINAILPITSEATAKVKDYEKVTEFNAALNALCKQEQITFIDSGYLLTSADQYEFDGIHPKYDFYPEWLEHLLEVSE